MGILRGIDVEQKEYTLKTDGDRAFYQSYMAFYGSIVQAHLNAITKYASMAIQGTFILNGTVGIAAFSQIQNGRGALVCCACGAICSILAAYFAYITQQMFFAADVRLMHKRIRRYFFLRDNQEKGEARGCQKWRAVKHCVSIPITYLVITAFFCLASLALFGIALLKIS